MVVIYTTIKKTDRAPDVTKLSLGKELRGPGMCLCRGRDGNGIVEKSSPMGGLGGHSVLRASSGPLAFSWHFHGTRLPLCAQVALLL